MPKKTSSYSSSKKWFESRIFNIRIRLQNLYFIPLETLKKKHVKYQHKALSVLQFPPSRIQKRKNVHGINSSFLSHFPGKLLKRVKVGRVERVKFASTVRYDVQCAISYTSWHLKRLSYLITTLIPIWCWERLYTTSVVYIFNSNCWTQSSVCWRRLIPQKHNIFANFAVKYLLWIMHPSFTRVLKLASNPPCPRSTSNLNISTAETKNFSLIPLFIMLLHGPVLINLMRTLAVSF